MIKVTYFDVEYANSKNKSICQIGLMCENYTTGDPVYPERDIYINPEDEFDCNCICIHNITPDRVRDAMNFPAAWKDIERYFTNTVVIGHNVASADLDALIKALKRYNLDIPEIYYICTYELAREYVPAYEVENYSMSKLCEYFNIDIDSEHNAFDDACACADLFKTIVDIYNIDVEKHVRKYVPKETREFSRYVSNPMLRKSISEFYGVIRGLAIDSVVSNEEVQYIKQWKKEKEEYADQREIADILCVIDRILADGIVTNDEMMSLQVAVKSYLDIVKTSPITLATQILDGILKGIIVDGDISEAECKNLRQWLYDNIYLSDHYPFNKAITMIDTVLEDSKVTKEEAEYITSMINDLLNPVQMLTSQVNDINGKRICLTGDFAYGAKANVEKYIAERGGVIEKSVVRSLDILIVGDNECQAYANGTYGTKIKKAIEYNGKGCNIQIVKEKDFFDSVK